jgi:hypothetical protein
MRKTFYSDKLDWESLGYSAPPTPPDDPELLEDEEPHLWLRLERVLGQAKAGTFDELPTLLDLYEEAYGAVLRYVCTRVLGDAGTAPCFRRMIEELETEKGNDPNKTIHYCSAFRAWGSLSTVPIILEQYHELRKSQEAAILPMNLSSMLEAEWGPISDGAKLKDLPAYSRLVMDRYEELKRQFETDQVIVYGGEVAGVIPYAKWILKRLGDTPFEHVSQSFLRRRFEASTGINCSAFYKKGRFQPLKAAAIVEDFLESPQAATYQDGVRYFFGHRIPD